RTYRLHPPALHDALPILPTVKTLSLGVVIWGVLGTTVLADPLIMNGGNAAWRFWMSGEEVRLSTGPASGETQSPPQSQTSPTTTDRKSTRLNSSHGSISY